MSDVNTIKVWLAFANSDDPESQFEQNMMSAGWHSLRIDTRTMPHVSKEFVQGILDDCNGNEDADDFRVRVRGLPRKSSSDSIISAARVQSGLNGRVDRESMRMLPVVLTCDPAWTGGDETCIWVHQGNWSRLLEKYKLNKLVGDTHLKTYIKLCEYEKEYGADYVWIDQAEGTALFTMAQAQSKHHWELISFANSANDALEFKDSQYQNMRAQMYYEAEKWLAKGGVLESARAEWVEYISKQLCWTKGTRNKGSLKKQAEPKEDIKKRVGQSPDIADGFVLRFARVVYDRREENMLPAEREVFGVNTQVEEYDPYADM
jgi:hypothetical protein